MKSNKEKRKQIRLYRKMLRTERRKLIKEAKICCPFDWSFYLGMINATTKFFLKYYSDGNNVYMCEEQRQEIVNQLTSVAELLERIDNDVYYIDKAEELYSQEEYKNSYSSEGDLYDYLIQHDINVCFSIIAEHCREWWD